MSIYIIALTPLLLAITGLAVALPIGLHYADKERVEREKAERATHVAGLRWAPILTEPTIVFQTDFDFGQAQITFGRTQSQPGAFPLKRQPSGQLPEAA